MKKLGLLIAMILCVTIGGVYASWTYTQSTDVADETVNMAMNLTDVKYSGSYGTYTVDASKVSMTIDPKPGTQHITALTITGDLVITFTPNSVAPNEIKERIHNLIAGLVSMGLGILLIVNPFGSAELFLRIMGIVIVIGSIAELIETAMVMKTLEDVKEIDGHIYQLNINSTYTPTSSTHTGQILKDGVDVTSATYYNKFRWYLMKATGKSQITTGISGATLSMQLADYMYGMALVLEWVDNNDGILLRKQIVLFDNAIIEREMRKVENTATQAKSIADNTDQHFWNISSGTDTGFHITEVEKDSFLANPNGYNLLSKSVGVAVRNAADEMAIFTDTGAYFNGYLNGVWQQIAAYTNSYAQIGSTASGQKNLRLDTNGMYLRNGANNLAEYTTTGMTLYNSSKYKTAYAGNSGFKLYDGTANGYEIASFTSNGMVIKDMNNRVVLTSTSNSLQLYNKNDY